MSIVEKYKQQLHDLVTRFSLVIDEYKKDYPKYKMNPDYKPYIQSFEQNNANLTTADKDSFLLRNNVEVSMDNLNSEIEQANKKIQYLKDNNIILSRKLQKLKNSDSGAVGLVNEYEQLYNWSLVSTVNISVGTAALIWLIYQRTKA